jgi:membrane protein YdbS with pleckstrin-like domain
LSREEVKKYFEVRFFSLALMAIGIFVVCVFLLVFFISRGQYVYAVAVIALAVIVLLAALELYRYTKILKRREKVRVQKTQIAPFAYIFRC